jgi:thioredoxin reductase (NADPH)
MSTRAPALAPETPDSYGAFPRLEEEQIDELRELGEVRPTKAGDVLFREGEDSADLFVILDGQVAIVENYRGSEERVIGIHGPGRFLGELNLLTGQVSFTTAVVTAPGEVLAVPAAAVRELACREPALGDILLRACLVRRSMLVGLATGLRIVGSRHSPDARRLREFAARNRIPHVWLDLEEDRTAEALLQEFDVAPEDTPIVIWRGKEVLRNPSNAEVGRLIGLRAPPARGQFFDLVVAGAGPAGLTAAVYAASDGLEAVVLDAVATGGQAATASRIENYLGFPEGISGADLADRALIQARKFDARISVPAEVRRLERRGGNHLLSLEDGDGLECRALVIATGARYRKLDVPRLEEFEKTSVHYAATPLEAQLCQGEPVAVVGGGNSAGQGALFLSRYGATVSLFLREDELTRNMSRYLADRIERAANIEVRRHSEVRELVGDGELEAVVVEDNRTGRRERVAARALFVFIGANPCSGWLAGQVELDDGGYILTGPAAGSTSLLETSRPGVFAAGDVRSGSAQRVAAAVGEGAMAVRLVHEHLRRTYAASG